MGWDGVGWEDRDAKAAWRQRSDGVRCTIDRYPRVFVFLSVVVISCSFRVRLRNDALISMLHALASSLSCRVSIDVPQQN